MNFPFALGRAAALWHSPQKSSDSEKQMQNEVSLPAGETGSAFFYRLLLCAQTKFPELPLGGSAKAFKENYGDVLCRFEAARMASKNRLAIAKHLAEETLASLRFGDDPLLQALAQKNAPPPTETIEASREPALRVEIPLDGKVYRGKDGLSALAKLHDGHHLTDAALKALSWIVERIEKDGGVLDLRQMRFALLGAAAEISPARLLLAGGATVRWVDVKAPDNITHGRVIFRRSDDLLSDPVAVANSLRAFCDEGETHLGLFAYAPGASRELRVAAAMNAVAQNLPHLKSVALLISPTSPAPTEAEDLRVADSRAPWWQRALGKARALPSPGHFGGIARSVVALQGVGYQAAQYLGKITVAEHWATGGLADGVIVSANVAGITNTRSLAHPLFQLAFAGAPSFGVRIFEPATTRTLSALLLLHDLLNADAPVRGLLAEEKVRALRAQQVHGGVYDLPWKFDRAVQTAAVIGLMRRPQLLLKRRAT